MSGLIATLISKPRCKQFSWYFCGSHLIYKHSGRGQERNCEPGSINLCHLPRKPSEYLHFREYPPALSARVHTHVFMFFARASSRRVGERNLWRLTWPPLDIKRMNKLQSKFSATHLLNYPKEWLFLSDLQFTPLIKCRSFKTRIVKGGLTCRARWGKHEKRILPLRWEQLFTISICLFALLYSR